MLYSTLIGGTFTDVADAITIDTAGNAYVAGYTTSIPAYASLAGSQFVPFPTTPGAFYKPGNQADVFVAKINAAGTALIYSSVFGGAGNDNIASLALDAGGAAYFTGSTYSTDWPLSPRTWRTKYGQGFAGKLSADGSQLVYSTFLSGAASPAEVDGAGNALIAGSTYYSDLATTPDAMLPCFPSGGPGDYSSKPYVVRLNSAGTAALYSSFTAGAIVALDAVRFIYVASDTQILDRMDVLAPAQPGLRCVVNAADYRENAIAAGEIVTLFGPGIGPDQAAGAVVDPSGKVTTTLENTRVLIGGVAAPLLYVSAHQINAVVPFEIAGQTQTRIQIEKNGTVSLPAFQTAVADAAPAIFTLDGSGYGQAAALNQDGTVNSADHPAPGGSVVSLFVTGIGTMQPVPADGMVPVAPFAKPALPVTVIFLFLPFPAELPYVGDAPTLVEGAVQINIQLPGQLPPGPQTLYLVVGDAPSPGALNVMVHVAGG